MKIGVLSDTHGSLVQTKKAFEYFKDADLIIHLGDVLYLWTDVIYKIKKCEK